VLATVMLFAVVSGPATPSAAVEENHDATVHHAFDDVSKWVDVFDDPGRDAWQRPDAVLREIGVKPGMTVADLGAGTGYFSVHLAKAVGEEGRVLAIDVEPKLVDYVRQRAAKANLARSSRSWRRPTIPSSRSTVSIACSSSTRGITSTIA